MSKNEIVDLGIPLPKLAWVDAVGATKLNLQWARGARAGRIEVVDLAPIIGSFKIYRSLRNNEALFQTAHIGLGGSFVAWDGPDLEVSAETIQQLAEQTMTPDDFVDFMKRYKLTQEAVAAVLGYSRRQIATYAKSGPIPRVVALACKGYETEQIQRRLAENLRTELSPVFVSPLKPQTISTSLQKKERVA